MAKLKKLYGAISKVDEQADGSIIVEGIASSESEDGDGEVVKADAMRAAIPDYMKFGAVREMHKAIAAGTALGVSVGEDNVTTIKAHIVDSESVKKVKAGVLKGFSIGGTVTGRDDLQKTIITGLKLTEISLVDRPCNPEAVITCYKADGIEPEPLQKGMYGVQEFACSLRNISYLVEDAQWESDCEGDNSPIPAQLLEWLKQGVVVFNAMAAEETAEMIASLEAKVSKAQQADDLQKAGQKFSKATKQQLAEVHQMMKTCSDKMAAIGYEAAEDGADDADKAAHADDLAKAAKAVITPELSALAKAAGITTADDAGTDDLAKAALTKVDELTKRVTELEAQPAAPKAAQFAVEKAADAGKVETEMKPVTKADGTVDETATLIKAAFAKPMRVM